MVIAGSGRAALADFLAIPIDDRHHELIDGQIVEKAAPSAEHGGAQSSVTAMLKNPFQRPPGRGGPGGWWILTEVEVLLSSGEVVRPDVVGWRRDRHPEHPSGAVVNARPDWVCEVISPARAADDTVRKLRLYAAAGVPHYWLVDSRDETLTVMRWTASGYVVALKAVRPERVRAEPFEAIEIAVGQFFGDDPE